VCKYGYHWCKGAEKWFKGYPSRPCEYCCRDMQEAAVEAIKLLHYGGCQGGLSESECQFGHDSVTKLFLGITDE
jgi:hypothetical protein